MLRITFALLFIGSWAALGAEPTIIDLWPDKPPGEFAELPPETDVWKDTDKLIGGRKIQKITNVSKPTLTIYRPAKEIDTGAAVVICPGGGFRILAYDHEGTEVAEWLAKNGITGIVLKYRVPFRDAQQLGLPALQDAQRAVRTVRAKAAEWGIDPKRIGILGFSAGGETAAMLSILHRNVHYKAVDKIDEVSSRPDFAILLYPGGLIEKGSPRLRDVVVPTKETPPMFLAHAFDDGVDVRNSLLLAVELKAAKVPCELHVFPTGGHGYGIRDTGHAVNNWPKLSLEWIKTMGFLKR